VAAVVADDTIHLIQTMAVRVAAAEVALAPRMVVLVLLILAVEAVAVAIILHLVVTAVRAW
jgi:hypothetical protein